MRAGLLISLMLMGLTAAVGCGASATMEAVDPSSDPAWIPPGQGDLAVADAPEPEVKPKKKPRARHLEKPNRAELDSRPLHAKTGR
jgi:hypothetical protein